MSVVTVKLYRLDDKVPLPTPASEGASGCDLRANGTYIVPPKTVCAISTGLFVAIPEGFEWQIRSRSGLAAKSRLFVLNSPGTLDSDYRGEVGVLLYNAGDKDYRVAMGERIAQAVLCPVYHPAFELVETLEALGDTARGSGGFGSTGG